MRSHPSAQERLPALDLEVCDEDGRVVDHVIVRDLSAGAADEHRARWRPVPRRGRTGH